MIRGLYGIADAGFGDPVELGRLWLEGGARVLQVRCKGWSTPQVRGVLDALRAPCRRANVPLIINDNHMLASACDGVHLGQDDGPFPESAGLRGRSTHDLDQLQSALAEGVDYVGFGPVFGSTTKPHAGERRGLIELAEIVQNSTVPVVAIGGIGPSNLDAVRATGAQAWAVISAVLGAEDPLTTARGMG